MGYFVHLQMIRDWSTNRRWFGWPSIWEKKRIWLYVHNWLCSILMIVKKWLIVTLSSCEVRYIAAASCACLAIWLRNLMKECIIYKMSQPRSTLIYVGSRTWKKPRLIMEKANTLVQNIISSSKKIKINI